MLGLTRARQEADLACCHAAFAVVAQGGADLATTFPLPVALRLLDVAVLLGKPNIVRVLSSIIGHRMKVRPLTSWDMAAILDQPDVFEAAIIAGASFARSFRTVISHPGPYKYEALSLFALAVLGGHMQTANVLCRARMAWFNLDAQALNWPVRWKYKVESFNGGQLHERFQRVGLPKDRWDTVAYVVKRALSRAGATYGLLLLQLMDPYRNLSVVHEVLTFLAELPHGLWDLFSRAR